jgi:hypothetical protein
MLDISGDMSGRNISGADDTHSDFCHNKNSSVNNNYFIYIIAQNHRKCNRIHINCRLKNYFPKPLDFRKKEYIIEVTNYFAITGDI